MRCSALVVDVGRISHRHFARLAVGQASRHEETGYAIFLNARNSNRTYAPAYRHLRPRILIAARDGVCSDLNAAVAHEQSLSEYGKQTLSSGRRYSSTV